MGQATPSLSSFFPSADICESMSMVRMESLATAQITPQALFIQWVHSSTFTPHGKLLHLLQGPVPVMLPLGSLPWLPPPSLLRFCSLQLCLYWPEQKLCFPVSLSSRISWHELPNDSSKASPCTVLGLSFLIWKGRSKYKANHKKLLRKLNESFRIKNWA